MVATVDLPGRWGWVWTEPPQRLDGMEGAFVRSANGTSTKEPVAMGGFDFLANWHAWQKSTTKPLVAWNYLYPSSDPLAAAEAQALADAKAYVIDIEEAGHPAGQVRNYCRRLRELRPNRAIGFSSYPTRAQAVSHGVPWDELIDCCDFGAPQVYYGYQEAAYSQVLADHKGMAVHLDLSPEDVGDASWVRLAQRHLDTGAGVSFWRLGILSGAERYAIEKLTVSTQGGMFMGLSDAEQQELLQAARQINGAVGAGQLSYEKTIEATLATAQKLVNLVQQGNSTLAGGINDLRSALLGAIAAQPGMTAEQAQAIVDEVVAGIEQHGVTMNADAVLEALRLHPLAPIS